MLEVHMPHKPLHGLGEFLLHLFTISVGLLIATQIESCVEWRHHVHLAEEARTSLRAEIEHNLADLKDAEAGVKQWRKAIDADLAAMQLIERHPNDRKAQQATLTVSSSGISLRDTAWRTAQATGGLAYMPYDEAQRYAGVYQAQTALMAFQDKPLEDAAGIFGLIAKYDFQASNSKGITAEQASAVAEKLGQMRLHLAAGDTLLQMSIETSSAFLENRKPRDRFEENLH